MAKRDEPKGGSWLLAEEFLERGDPAFVAELRSLHDADRLANLAAKWLVDRRPASRKLLLAYLEQPFNAFRHEGLIKRLFKLAEKAGDDELMVRFLVGFDRSIRRERHKRYRYDWNSREQWSEESIRPPKQSTLPRDFKEFRFRDPKTGDRLAARSAEKHAALRLFSLATRKYLRRRAWRYFRQLAQQHPDRFLASAVEALRQFVDDDVTNGLALLDNWGLMHLLFHDSPTVVAFAAGWKLAEGKSLAELAPAPAEAALWKQSPTRLIEVLIEARCRPVRQWAMTLLRRDHADALAKLSLRELLALVANNDDELAQFAAEALAKSPELAHLRATEWLQLLETANAQVLGTLCELIERSLDPASVGLEQAVALAGRRPLPIARLGFAWLQKKSVASDADCRLVMRLADAEAEVLRPELIRWLRKSLSGSRWFRGERLLDLLESRHADVRGEGWAWFVGNDASQDIAMWQKLLESPYDDIRFEIVAMLEQRVAKQPAVLDRGRLDPTLIRLLWATVLLNVHRGSRAKPRVVAQIAARLARQADEAPLLLPILGVALRSVRGPEFRAGIAALVQLSEQHPELEPTLSQQFPEFHLART